MDDHCTASANVAAASAPHIWVGGHGISPLLKLGGEEGIRTPDTLSGMPVFKTGAINHSATSPVIQFYYNSAISRLLQRNSGRHTCKNHR